MYVICICLWSCYICWLSITHVMEAAFGRLYNSGRAALHHQPTVVECIMGDEERIAELTVGINMNCSRYWVIDLSERTSNRTTIQSH